MPLWLLRTKPLMNLLNLNKKTQPIFVRQNYHKKPLLEKSKRNEKPPRTLLPLPKPKNKLSKNKLEESNKLSNKQKTRQKKPKIS